MHVILLLSFKSDSKTLNFYLPILFVKLLLISLMFIDYLKLSKREDVMYSTLIVSIRISVVEFDWFYY